MLENLKVSAAIVLPFFLYLLIGMMLKKIHILDEDLAGEIVTFSSMFSLFTLFLWIFCFKQAGLIS